MVQWACGRVARRQRPWPITPALPHKPAGHVWLIPPLPLPTISYPLMPQVRSTPLAALRAGRPQGWRPLFQSEVLSFPGEDTQWGSLDVFPDLHL